jgi:hypothetical protein
MDGARLWNAANASGVAPADYAATVDTVMVTLSKGLGCPVGSLLAGPRRSWRRLAGAASHGRVHAPVRDPGRRGALRPRPQPRPTRRGSPPRPPPRRPRRADRRHPARGARYQHRHARPRPGRSPTAPPVSALAELAERRVRIMFSPTRSGPSPTWTWTTTDIRERGDPADRASVREGLDHADGHGWREDRGGGHLHGRSTWTRPSGSAGSPGAG